jgi:hypothetical protein
VRTYGDWCCELDALDPNILRERVRKAIVAHIEPEAWNKCVNIEKAETESLETVINLWTKLKHGGEEDEWEWWGS